MIRRGERGFTLIEVMVALFILTIGYFAISAAQTASIRASAHVYRKITAAHLIRGVVQELELEYLQDGFPSNSLEGRTCELPKELAKSFTCKYDLVRIDAENDLVDSMSTEGLEALLGGVGGMGDAVGKGTSVDDMDLTNEAMGAFGGVNDEMVSAIPFLAPFMGPEADVFMNLCSINFQAVMASLMGMMSFMPMIIQYVSDRTRKLTVTLTWKEGYKDKAELKVTTYITSLPEEEVEKMKGMEELQELQEDMGTTTPAGGKYSPGGSGSKYSPGSSGSKYGSGGPRP